MPLLLAVIRFLANPLNWLKMKSVVDALIGVYTMVKDQIAKFKREKLKDKIDEASNQVDQVKQTQPDNLEAQADALCKLEKVTNPNSSCDK